MKANIKAEPRTQVKIDTFGPDGIRALEPMSEQTRERLKRAPGFVVGQPNPIRNINGSLIHQSTD